MSPRLELKDLRPWESLTSNQLGLMSESRQSLRRQYAVLPTDQSHIDESGIQLSLDLAALERELGELTNARRLQREAAVTLRNRFGNEDPLTRMAFFELAVTLYFMGSLQESGALLDDLHNFFGRTLGYNHPQTLRVVVALSAIRFASCDFSQARQFDEDVLALRRESEGDRHPNTLLSMRGLALSLANLGSGHQAISLLEAVLEAYRRDLDTEHVDTAQVEVELAACLLDSDSAKAGPLVEHAMTVFHNEVGSGHPLALGANILQSLLSVTSGDRSVFDQLDRSSLPRVRSRFGICHPLVVGTVRYLTLFHIAHGELQEALEVNEQLLRDLYVSSRDDIEVLATIQAQADLLSQLGRAFEAVEIQRHLVNRMKDRLGLDNLDTLVAEAMLGQRLIAMGQVLEARDVLSNAAENLRRTHGPNRPETIMVETELALLSNRLGDLDFALSTIERSMTSVNGTLRESDIIAIRSTWVYAEILVSAGQIHPPRRIADKALDVATRSLGAGNPLTLELLNLITRIA